MHGFTSTQRNHRLGHTFIFSSNPSQENRLNHLSHFISPSTTDSSIHCHAPIFISICSNNCPYHLHLFHSIPFHSMATKEPSSSLSSEDAATTKRVQYPVDSHSYKLLDEIGSGVSAIVYKAICIPMNSSLVAIKSIDLDGSRPDFDDVRREAKTLSLLSHPNILNAHCCFTVDHRLWVVMPFMAGGSFQSIITHSFPDGLTEPCIAVILRDTLNALSYLHSQGHLHRDVKAGNILVDSNGSVKLADFGVSASIYESLMSSSSSYSASNSSSSSCCSSLMLKDVAGTPYWMAPEVIHSHVGYSFKADIWSFGITALELAHGRPPLSHLPPSKSMILKITKRFRFSDFDMCKKESGGKKKFSKAFKDMVGSCLDQDPSKRPTAEKLLKHPFFKNCKGSEVLVKNVLQGLPSVEKRYKEISKVVMHDATTSPNEEHDEEEDDYDPMKQGLKQRRISGWNFNEDGLELEPVFPNDDRQNHHSKDNNDDEEAILKEVRFGGETIIQQIGESEQHHHHHVVGSGEAVKEPPKHCGADVVAEGGCTEVVDKIGGGGGIVMNVKNREGMLGTLNVLKRSLEQELRQVKLLIKMIQGDHHDDHVVDSEEQIMHDEISRLRAELEDERNKNKRLNMESQHSSDGDGHLNISEI